VCLSWVRSMRASYPRSGNGSNVSRHFRTAIDSRRRNVRLLPVRRRARCRMEPGAVSAESGPGSWDPSLRSSSLPALPEPDLSPDGQLCAQRPRIARSRLISHLRRCDINQNRPPSTAQTVADDDGGGYGVAAPHQVSGVLGGGTEHEHEHDSDPAHPRPHRQELGDVARRARPAGRKTRGRGLAAAMDADRAASWGAMGQVGAASL